MTETLILAFSHSETIKFYELFFVASHDDNLHCTLYFNTGFDDLDLFLRSQERIRKMGSYFFLFGM